MFRSERMADSGIEVDFDFMSSDYPENDSTFDQTRFYNLKSKAIVSSPVTDIKITTPPTRTNLRQQLEKQQLYQQEKREQQFSQSFKVSTHVTGSTGITIPRVVSAAQVPANVLQVKTPLQHPTRYHVQESQKRQVEHFLSNGHHGAHIPVHSLPTSNVPLTVPQHNQYHVQASSSAPQPDLANSFLADPTDSEFNPSNFDLLRELQSVEPLELESFLDDDDLREIQPTIGESLRDDFSQAGLLQPPFDRLEPDGLISSCPTSAYNQQCNLPTLSVQDDLWRKERIKKDNHNIIERRRRFNINDRIKELGGLLPRTIDPDLRQNKGTILKASVEYIKCLQDDQRKYRMVLEQKKKADSDLRKVLLKLRQMQFLIKSHGIENPLLGDADLQGSNFNSVMSTEQLITPQVPSNDNHVMSMNTQPSFTSLLASDELMDECSSVCGDPMLLSDPLNPDADEHSLLFDHFQS
ncbi:hypothetical protein BsWGS_11137 [Bradybaena similaris]